MGLNGLNLLKVNMTNPRQLTFPFSIDKKSSIKKFFIPKGSEALINELSNKNGDDIFLRGYQGSGKTYLLQAACNDLNNLKFATSYIPLNEAIKLDTTLLDGLESLDLVCIDDIDKISSNKDWEVACFNLINRCNESGCRLIFSCKEGIDKFFPDLLSRLKKMTSFSIQPIQDSQLLDALRFISFNLKIPIEEREINYILNFYKRDLPSAIDLIKRIDEYSMGSKRRITIPLIKELLSN